METRTRKRGGNWLAAFCTAVFLLTAFAVGAWAESPDSDYGNSISTAPAINVNSTTAGTINYPGDTDWFRFFVPSNGMLSLSATGSTELYGSLKNSTGIDIVSGSLSSRGISASITAGTYYVSVWHYSSTGTGDYSLFINFLPIGTAAPDDHDNTIGAATLVNVNSVTEGKINYGGDWDYFRVDVPPLPWPPLDSSLPPLQSVRLTVYTDGSTDTYGYLMNSLGGVLDYNDDYRDRNFHISRDVRAGTYYVAVRHYSRTGTGPYNFYVTLSDDHGNSIGTATPVNVNSTTAGRIGYGRDSDYVRVFVPSSGTLTVSTTGSTDTYGCLKNSSGADLACNDDYGGSLNFRISARVTGGIQTSGGTGGSVPMGAYYYISVRHYSSTGTGPYTLYVNFMPDPLPDDHQCDRPTSVNVNSSTAGVINYPGDIDCFGVTMPSSGVLTVYTTGTTDTYGELRNSSNSLLVSNDDYGGSLNFRVSTAVTAGSAYYVRVRHYSSTGTGPYTLYVSFTPAPVVVNPPVD